MKSFKRFLAALLVIVMLIGMIPAQTVSAVAVGKIPDELQDNYVLDFMDALGYEMYGAGEQLAKGDLYELDYTVQQYYNKYSTKCVYDTTGIDYNSSGSSAYGTEQTSSGEMDVDKFQSKGLVCASYTAAYYLNYLPYTKGGFQSGDIGFTNMATQIKNAITSGNTRAAANWATALNTLVARFAADPSLTYDSYRIVKYTYADLNSNPDLYDKLDIGDLVLFYKPDSNGNVSYTDASKCGHTAIYMGEFREYGSGTDSSGIARISSSSSQYSSNGKVHWISNMTGSDSTQKCIGQDIVEVYIGAESYKSGFPVYYHFEYVTGTITINKQDQNGNALSGASFTVTNTSTGTSYTATSSSGKAVFSGLPMGTYQIVETTAPSGYIKDDTTYTVSLAANDKSKTLTIKNDLAKKSISVQKSTDTGTNLSGWLFDVYTSSGTYIETITTNSAGVATTSDLDVGQSYIIKEAGHTTSSNWNTTYWAYDTTATNGGSINLLKNASLTSTTLGVSYGWYKSDSTDISYTTLNGYNVLGMPGTISSSNTTRGFIANAVGHLHAGTYTFSGKVYVEEDRHHRVEMTKNSIFYAI